MSSIYLRRIAVFLWALSFLLPTLRLPTGEVVMGYQLVWLALLLLPAFFLLFGFFAAPLVLSFFTNGYFVMEMLSALRRSIDARPSPKPVWLAIAIAVNIAVPLRFSRTADLPPLGLPGITSLPGYFCWLLAFIILLLASLADRPHICKLAPAMLKRIFLLAVVSGASVVFFGVLAFLLG